MLNIYKSEPCLATDMAAVVLLSCGMSKAALKVGPLAFWCLFCEAFPSVQVSEGI